MSAECYVTSYRILVPSLPGYFEYLGYFQWHLNYHTHAQFYTFGQALMMCKPVVMANRMRKDVINCMYISKFFWLLLYEGRFASFSKIKSHKEVTKQ